MLNLGPPSNKLFSYKSITVFRTFSTRYRYRPVNFRPTSFFYVLFRSQLFQSSWAVETVIDGWNGHGRLERFVTKWNGKERNETDRKEVERKKLERKVMVRYQAMFIKFHFFFKSKTPYFFFITLEKLCWKFEEKNFENS